MRKHELALRILEVLSSWWQLLDHFTFLSTSNAFFHPSTSTEIRWQYRSASLSSNVGRRTRCRWHDIGMSPACHRPHKIFATTSRTFAGVKLTDIRLQWLIASGRMCSIKFEVTFLRQSIESWPMTVFRTRSSRSVILFTGHPHSFFSNT